MRNTKDLYSQLVQTFDSSTIDHRETPRPYQAKATLAQKQEDVLNKIDLVNNGQLESNDGSGGLI